MVKIRSPHFKYEVLLWRGLAAYCMANEKRYLFGCCSLTSQNAAEGWKALQNIEENNFLHSEFFISPRPEFVYENENISQQTDDKNWQLPKLFLTYMRFGAKVCSPPAIDCEFGTIDFFVMFDFEMIDEKYRRMFIG